MRAVVAAVWLLAGISAASAQPLRPQCGGVTFGGVTFDPAGPDISTPPPWFTTGFNEEYLRVVEGIRRNCAQLEEWKRDARKRPPEPVIGALVRDTRELIKKFNKIAAEFAKRRVPGPQPPAWPPIAITVYGGGTFGHNNPALGAGQNLALGSGAQGGVAATFEFAPMYIQDGYKTTPPLVTTALGIRFDSSDASVDQVQNNVGGGAVNTTGNLTQNKLLFTAGARFQPVANLLVAVNFGAGPSWQDLLVRGPLGNVVLTGRDTSLALTAGVELLIPVFENVHAGPYLQFTRTNPFNATLPNGTTTTIGSHEAFVAGLKLHLLAPGRYAWSRTEHEF